MVRQWKRERERKQVTFSGCADEWKTFKHAVIGKIYHRVLVTESTNVLILKIFSHLALPVPTESNVL